MNKINEEKDIVKNVEANDVDKKVETIVKPTSIFNPSAMLVEHCTSMEAVMNSNKNINFIIGNDGAVYEIRKNKIGTFKIKTNKVIGGTNITEGSDWKLPKIPFQILLTIVSFFQDVCREFNNDESMIQIYYDTNENKYFTICPKQSTTKVAVVFQRDQELDNADDKILVMDIHSHNTMDAFFSGIDDKDEKETRLFGVFGKFNEVRPHYKFRMGVAGKFVLLNISDIFEMPTITFKCGDTDMELPVNEENIIFPTVSYPEEWLEIVREGKSRNTQVVTSPTYNSNFNWDKYAQSNFNNTTNDDITDEYFLDKQEDNEINGQMDLFHKETVNNCNKSFYETIEQKKKEKEQEKETIKSYITDDDEPFDMDLADELAQEVVSNLDGFDFLRFIDLICDEGYEDEIIKQLKDRGYSVK